MENRVTKHIINNKIEGHGSFKWKQRIFPGSWKN